MSKFHCRCFNAKIQLSDVEVNFEIPSMESDIFSKEMFEVKGTSSGIAPKIPCLLKREIVNCDNGVDLEIYRCAICDTFCGIKNGDEFFLSKEMQHFKHKSKGKKKLYKGKRTLVKKSSVFGVKIPVLSKNELKSFDYDSFPDLIELQEFVEKKLNKKRIETEKRIEKFEKAERAKLQKLISYTKKTEMYNLFNLIRLQFENMDLEGTGNTSYEEVLEEYKKKKKEKEKNRKRQKRKMELIKGFEELNRYNDIPLDRNANKKKVKIAEEEKEKEGKRIPKDKNISPFSSLELVDSDNNSSVGTSAESSDEDNDEDEDEDEGEEEEENENENENEKTRRKTRSERKRRKRRRQHLLRTEQEEIDRGTRRKEIEGNDELDEDIKRFATSLPIEIHKKNDAYKNRYIFEQEFSYIESYMDFKKDFFEKKNTKEGEQQQQQQQQQQQEGEEEKEEVESLKELTEKKRVNEKIERLEDIEKTI